jgi:hypothetical protein
MSISDEVNIDVLNEVYALSAFHGLRAAHSDDQWNHQMTEETEGYLPNADMYTHDDATAHDETNIHVKPNPTLEAMQRAVGTISGTGGSIELPHHPSTNVTTSIGVDKNNKHTKPNEGQLDHNSLNGSDYISTPLNKSTDDLTDSHGYVFDKYSNFSKDIMLFLIEMSISPLMTTMLYWR